MHGEVPQGVAARPVARRRHGGDGRYRRRPSKLGTVSTPAGSQITYGGKALYWYVKDKAPGQVKGNIKDKWGKWATVVTVKGKGSSGGSKKTNSGTGGTAF